MLEAEQIALLTAAQRARTHDVDATLFAGLDRSSAYRVQTGVLAALHQTAGMLKTAIHSDGVVVVAPIYATSVAEVPGFHLPVANVVGVEVEVGVVLRKALTGSVDETQVRSAIDHYFVGVEICGSRYRDRKLAGLNGGLADNMSSLGYAIGSRREAQDQIDGLTVRVQFAGHELHSAPARHGFGTVLASLIAYANNRHPSYPLAAGTIITTGSMCGLVPTSGPGHVVASLGDETVEFDIV
jgi:2-keto-4-pentenoate hydratase